LKKITNKGHAQEWLQITRDLIESVQNIDPSSSTAKRELEQAQTVITAVKQANNIFRSGIQHDVARGKIEGYKSSFIESFK